MLFKSGEEVTKDYDVIVVGSGLGGMTAANMLGKNGRSVLLLEGHNKLGGLATWFKRSQGQHIFDVSLHGFPSGMIKTCRKYWTRELANSIERIRGVRFENPMFQLSTDFTREDYIDKLITYFKVPQEKVFGFFDGLAQLNFYDGQEMTNQELFDKFFSGRKDVLRFLLEPIIYANGSNLEDPATSYAIVFSNFMKDGVYTYKGGTDQFISKMKEELLRNQVDIKMHSKVDRILVENKKVVGVLVKGKIIKAKAVLSNASLLGTIKGLVGESSFSSEFYNEALKVRPNTSSCQVYMGLKEGEEIPRREDLIFYSEDDTFTTDLILSPRVGSQTFSLYYPDMRPQRPNHYAIVSSSNARYEDWAYLSPEEYEKRKKYLIEKALTSLEKLMPGVSKKINYIEAATPRTVERYTYHYRGSSFGTKFEGLKVSNALPQEIEGLYHAGSVGIIMSGWLGAANYGVMKAFEMENYL